jgi:hypothetical protein
MATEKPAKPSTTALARLTELLEPAVSDGADAVTLEYQRDGLEVTFMFGNTGVGGIVCNRASGIELLNFIEKTAKLRSKLTGTMSLTLNGKEHTIYVREYDSFGETAFELRLTKPEPKKRRGSGDKG